MFCLDFMCYKSVMHTHTHTHSLGCCPRDPVSDKADVLNRLRFFLEILHKRKQTYMVLVFL